MHTHTQGDLCFYRCEDFHKHNVLTALTLSQPKPESTLPNPNQPYPTLTSPNQLYPTLINSTQSKPYPNLPNPNQPQNNPNPNPTQPYLTLTNPIQP